MRVALDIEGCLDRFYGGYYSGKRLIPCSICLMTTTTTTTTIFLLHADWACGGQFNRCFEFVQLLANAFQAAQIDVVVFFDGTLKENKKLQMERNDFRQKTISVSSHCASSQK